MRHYIVKSQVKNIIDMFHLSLPREKNEGANWYLSAHKYAKELSIKYNKDLFVVSGIIAALSPGITWEQNKIDAETFLRHKKAKKKIDKAYFSTYGPNVLKAVKIYKATNLQDVHKILRGKVGFKTANFFVNIFCPNYDKAVTVDRHAYKIANKNASGGGVSLTAKKYRETKEAYLIAGKQLNVSAVKLQAITWVAFRRINGISKNEVNPF